MNSRRARPLLGTLVDIRLSDRGSHVNLGRAFEAAFGAVERVHKLMSAHDLHSDVSCINRSRPGELVTVDSWTYWVIEAALEVANLTGGLFDPCVAPLLQEAGLLPGVGDRRALYRADYRALRLLGKNRIQKVAPLQLTLDGIAKGFAVDRATETLKAEGVVAGIVNAGGDLAVFGPEPEPIHVRHPANPGQLLFVGHLREGALATSGGCLSRMASSERELPHVFDPRTGSPVARSASATVLASQCMFADALAKAVLLDAEAARPALDRCHATVLALDGETMRRAA